jgi:hypothetical protein
MVMAESAGAVASRRANLKGDGIGVASVRFIIAY